MRDYRIRLADIQESSEKIVRYSFGTIKDEFLENDMMFDAVVRNLEIIGEAARHVPEEVQENYSDINWRKMIGLRNIVAHEYFGVDGEIVWDLVSRQIPELLKQIRYVRAAENSNG